VPANLAQSSNAECRGRDHQNSNTCRDHKVWGHLRTSNPIESVFATVRHRTVRTKGALSQKTAKLMVFTLIQAASKKWLRLKGRNQLPKVIEGIKFTDGIKHTNDTENRAAG
jgi:putative transposase